ncbi:MAG TPA: sigma 54-interacting transcriptional regulator [Terracidiphilus sp.]|nr:sigma 54-interacting transcriptional regulator [Terracidiphilus sp.]
MSMQPVAQVSTHPSASGIKLVGPESADPPLVGVNPAWRKLLVQAETVAPHVQFAAIEGEPGSGKQTLARFLHSRTPLAHGPFVRRDVREWLVTEADPATLSGFLYLDRIDLLAAPGQGLLLGVLKALQDRPAGRVIVVVSSQTSLRQLATQGLLLPDLAFRFTAVRFAVPSLRLRREDIAPLAQTLLERICARYQLRPVTLGPGALARLLQHAWPGNIRELASVLEAALLEAGHGILRAEDLLLPMLTESQPAQNSHSSAPPLHLALDSVVQHHVQYVLDLNRGNKLRAARQLGISRSTLYRILGNDFLLPQ